jgi:hypothetical protein
LDLVKFTKEHLGKGEPDMQHSMELEADEHITFMQVHYVSKGISYMMFRTNLKQIMRVEDEEAGE